MKPYWLNENKQTIIAEIDGIQVSIPNCPGNRHFDEITAQYDLESLPIGEPKKKGGK